MEGSQSNKNINLKEPPVNSNINRIIINVAGYKHILARYENSIVSITANFLNEELGPAQTYPLLSREYIATDFYYSLKYDKTDPQDLDKLLSTPITFTLTEIEVNEQPDIKLLQPLPETTKEEVEGEIDYENDPDEIQLKKEIELQEVYTKVKTKREDLLPTKVVKKLKKEKEKKIKSLKGKSDNKTEDSAVEEKPKGPITIGMASLDLLPFFLGKTEIHQYLPVRKNRFFSIADCQSIRNTPYIQVKIIAEDPTVEVANTNIVNLTVESLYNIPSVMVEDMNYSIAVYLPISETDDQPLLFNNFKYCTTRDFVSEKRWYTKPDLQIDLPATKYKIDYKWNAIKNRAKANLPSLIDKEVLRIEYNVVKRTFMKEDLLEMFEKRIKKHRCILFEIYITPKSIKNQDQSLKTKTKSDKGKDKKNQEEESYLHLMAFADLSSLLYPGVKSCRVTCPIQTYHEQEINKRIGEYNSYFRPKKPEIKEQSPGKSSKKKEKKSDKSSKKSNKSSKKSDKSSKKSEKSTAKKGDLSEKLPEAPVVVEVEPSKFVYNEEGQPTFLLVEFELMNPLVPAKTIEDLSEKFYELIPQYPTKSKLIDSAAYAENYLKETVRKLVENINKQYQNFVQEIEESECQCEQDELSLIKYLHQEGIYKTYFSTIQRAISTVIASKYPEVTNVNEGTIEYQNLVSELYVYLINEMNKVINLMVLCDERRPPIMPKEDATLWLLYAKEACELGAYELAKRYHLQRLEQCDTNPDYWFDYAVYHVEIEKIDKAMECLKEALALNSIHINSLILYGTLLFEEEKYDEAETFYLLVTLHEPRLVEGWGILHLLYEAKQNIEGQELCMEMINKYIEELITYQNYFFDTDDLAWTTLILPKSAFIKVAALLLKMRTLKTANLAIANEIFDNEPHCHYLIGVSMYFHSAYQNSLYHLQMATKMCGFNYAIGGMIGHILLQAHQYDKAAEIYERILTDHNCPNNVHLIYVNAAIANDRKDNGQHARKLLLLACKYTPTPYTWLAAGLMYYKQKDLFSAEACLCQANVLDNVLPETWAYLALVNLQLNRICEAQLCYRQTIRNQLNDENLLEEIRSKLIKSDGDKKCVKFTYSECD